MFRARLTALIVRFVATVAGAQNAVQKIVDAEYGHTKRASEIGGGPSFVEFMIDDAFSFVRDMTSGKIYLATQTVDPVDRSQ